MTSPAVPTQNREYPMDMLAVVKNLISRVEQLEERTDALESVSSTLHARVQKLTPAEPAKKGK